MFITQVYTSVKVNVKVENVKHTYYADKLKNRIYLLNKRNLYLYINSLKNSYIFIY